MNENILGGKKEFISRLIHIYLSQGFGEENTKSQMIVDGFKEQDIDAVMTEIVRDRKVQEICDYMDYYENKGHEVEHLSDWILDNGVDGDLVEEALVKRQKKFL
ncbi:MAG: hypothetical protein ABH828_03980 [archaeon]